jgi:DNA-directed RNA polymerase specialized sigma subunit
MSTLVTPNVAPDLIEDEFDIWAAAAKDAEAVIGITAAAIRELWGAEHPAVAGDEAALVELALTGEDTTAREVARETLTAAYVGGPVKRIIALHTRREDAEDIRQSAAEGIWRGLNAFNPAKHRRPVATIQREVLAALDEVHAARFGLKVPEVDRLKYAKARAEAAKRIVAENGDGRGIEDLAAEIAPEFGLSTSDYWHVDRVVHLGEVQANGEAQEATARRAAGEGGEPFDAIWSEATPNVGHDTLVEAFLGYLDDREREVIARRFGLDGFPAHTEDEAAAALNLSDRRIRQIQAAALSKLRSTVGVADVEA